MNPGDSATRQEVRLGGPPTRTGGEDITWPDQVAPGAERRLVPAKSNLKPQTSKLSNVVDKVLADGSRKGLREAKSRGAPREWDLRGLSSENQWNPRESEGTSGAEEGSEEPKPLSFAIPTPGAPCQGKYMWVRDMARRKERPRRAPWTGRTNPRSTPSVTIPLKFLMHPDVLELHAVRVVHTPHGDERQLHLKVRVRCGREEKVVDVLVDTGAQVSLVRRGLFKEEFLQPSRRPVA